MIADILHDSYLMNRGHQPFFYYCLALQIVRHLLLECLSVVGIRNQYFKKGILGKDFKEEKLLKLVEEAAIMNI